MNESLEEAIRVVIEPIREEEWTRRGHYELRVFLPDHLVRKFNHTIVGPFIVDSADTVDGLRNSLRDNLLGYAQRYDLQGERCIIEYSDEGLSTLLEGISPKLHFHYAFEIVDTL